MRSMNSKKLRKLIEGAGGLSAVAREIGVTRQAVEQWIFNGVPAIRVRRLSEVTGASLAEIRPDLYGDLESPTRATEGL